MSPLLFRTHVTDLSDEELSFLDGLFESPQCKLIKVNDSGFYRIWKISEGRPVIITEKRHDAIASLYRRGVLVIIMETKGFCITIFPAGGELWSLERCPVWEKFALWNCELSSTDNSSEEVVVRTVSAAVRDQFVEYFGPWAESFTTGTDPSFSLSPWTALSTFFTARILLSEDGQEQIDEPDFLRKLTHRIKFWSNVSQLQNFLNPPNP